MNHEKHFHSAKALAYLTVAVIAFAIVYIYKEHQSDIMNSGSFNLFFGLTALGAMFLAALMYLISQSTAPKAKAVRKSPPKKKRSR